MSFGRGSAWTPLGEFKAFPVARKLICLGCFAAMGMEGKKEQRDWKKREDRD